MKSSLNIILSIELHHSFEWQTQATIEEKDFYWVRQKRVRMKNSSYTVELCYFAPRKQKPTIVLLQLPDVKVTCIT